MVVGAAVMAAILCVCNFSALGALGLVGPDEPRYAAIARDMAANGDWVTPRLFGQPWFEKPPLYYWSAALMFRAGLSDETAARVPSGIYALVATLALAWAAQRFYGARTALTLLLMLPTSAGMIGFAHAAATDMPFAACLTLAMVAAAQILWPSPWARQASPLQEESQPDQQAEWTWACAWGFFLGLAALAKGPAALALGAGSVTLWAVVTRRWRDALRLFHPAGVLAFAVTALPWYALCAWRNPTFLRVFLLEHNLERFATDRYQHAQPFWFFAPVLLLAIFPWTFLLGACARDALRVYAEKRIARAPALFFGCWAVFPLLFFSVSQSKLPGYILPAVPPLLLLIARCLARLHETNDAMLRSWLAKVAIAFLLLAGGTVTWLRSLPPEQGAAQEMAPLLAGSAIAGGLVVAILAAARRPRAALWGAAISVAILVVAVGWRLLPALDAQLSPRTEARAVLERAGGSGNLTVFEIPRAWNYGLNFYARRELPEWTPQTPRPVWVLSSDAGMIDLWRLGLRPRVELRLSRQARVLRAE